MAVEVDEEEKSSVKRPVAEEDDPASSSCGGNGKRRVSGKGAKGNANDMVSSCVGHKVPKKVPPASEATPCPISPLKCVDSY